MPFTLTEQHQTVAEQLLRQMISDDKKSAKMPAPFADLCLEIIPRPQPHGDNTFAELTNIPDDIKIPESHKVFLVLC